MLKGHSLGLVSLRFEGPARSDALSGLLLSRRGCVARAAVRDVKDFVSFVPDFDVWGEGSHKGPELSLDETESIACLFEDSGVGEQGVDCYRALTERLRDAKVRRRYRTEEEPSTFRERGYYPR